MSADTVHLYECSDAHDEWPVYCDDLARPATLVVADVTCLACLNAAHTRATSLAAECAARVAALSPVVTEAP